MNKPTFRAWWIKEKEMHNVCKLDFKNNQVDFCGADTVKIADIILMQSTGLKDKNGVDIFDGDIVKRKYESVNYDAEHYSHHAVFQDKTGAWRIMYPNKRMSNVVDMKKQIEVCGNIHANPELLNEVSG